MLDCRPHIGEGSRLPSSVMTITSGCVPASMIIGYFTTLPPGGGAALACV